MDGVARASTPLAPWRPARTLFRTQRMQADMLAERTRRRSQLSQAARAGAPRGSPHTHGCADLVMRGVRSMAAMRCWQALREAPVPETVEFTVWRVGALDAHGRTVAAPERLVVPTLILAAMSLDQSLVREVLARGADPRATHDGNSASDEATLLRLTPYASEAMARYSVAACSCAKDVVNACVATRTALATARV